MLLSGYRKEIFRPDCNPNFQSVHCIAHLDQDISAVLPYLNTELGGFTYIEDPPAVTFKVHGKLVTVYGDRIAVNALRDEEEAERVLIWLQSEINRCWENRNSIKPSTKGHHGPQVIEILRLLPRTNCGDCGQATCMLFANLVAEGGKGPSDCPEMDEKNRKALEIYLCKFPRPSW